MGAKGDPRPVAQVVLPVADVAKLARLIIIGTESVALVLMISALVGGMAIRHLGAPVAFAHSI